MKKSHKQALLWVIGLIVVAAVVYTVSRSGLNYLDDLIFTERQTQLQEVGNQYYREIDLVTENSWTVAHEMEQRFIQGNFQTVQELQDFFESEYHVQNLLDEDIRPIAIRADGQYIDIDGLHGNFGYTDPLSDCGERSNYIYEQPFTGDLFNLYVYRLDSPVTITNGENKYKIEFVGITRPMSSMNQYFRCTAYGGENSTYILDRYGSKQYVDRSDSMNLIEGHNVYTVLRREAKAEGRDFDAILAELNANGVVYSYINVNGEQCFFSMRKMPDTDYTIVYMNPASRVAVSTQQLINLVMRVIIWAAVVVLFMIIASVAYLMIRNRRQLDAEMRSKQEVLTMNEKLEQANHDLLKAQNATKDALQAAETASKAKTDFLSNMSHDIRTPMNAIVGLISLMENDLHDTEKVQEYLTKLKASSNHLLNLINEILDMNKIEAGKATLHSEPFKMAEQVAQIEDVIRPQAKAKEQQFTIRTQNVRHENLEGDATRLQQILLNILSNAVKYTDNGGHIELDIEEVPRDGHYARYKFTITDNGIGMSEEFQKHIYESFVRAENSVTNRVQGTGLGMAITKSIVDMMGGAISLESELGKGSRFEVMLEFKIDAEADKAVQTNSLLFLRCPDVEFERIQATTENSPVKVYRTSSPEETAQLLQKNHYDVIFMPQRIYGDGLKAAVQKVRLLAGEDTILLSIAPMPRDEAMDAISGSGLDGFITLPFFLSNMEAEVARVKERRSSDAQQEDKSVLVGMNFLCAEDNELNSEILQAMLEVQDASCTICHNGAEIVERFKTVKPGEFDAILMDVQMPIMDGHEATRAIRNGENPLGKSIPIIAMTANAFSEDVQQSYDAGMDAHLSKPINMEVLEKTLRQFRRTPPEIESNGGARFAR